MRKLPDLHAIPDFTGRHLTIDQLFNDTGLNSDWPKIGDVVIELTGEWLGTKIVKDTRFRVTKLATPHHTALVCTDETGKEEIVRVYNLRKYKDTPHVWLRLADDPIYKEVT